MHLEKEFFSLSSEFFQGSVESDNAVRNLLTLTGDEVYMNMIS